MIKATQKLFILLSKRTRTFVPVILLSILFIGLLEMLSVLLLMPLLTSDQFVGGGVGGSTSSMGSSMSFILKLFDRVNIHTIKQMAILIVAFMFIKHVLIISLNYFQYKIIFDNDIWLRNELLLRYTRRSFLSFSRLRSSELIRNTAEQVGQISYGSLLSLLNIISEAVVVFVLLGLILVTLPLKSTALIVAVFLTGLLPFYIFKRRIIYLGKVRFESISKTISEIQNIYNLYIEIRLYNIRDYFLSRVKKQSRIFTHAQIQNNVITNIPKGIIEISAVAVILILILNTKNDADFLPTIGIIVTSIFRISPSFTRISAALTQFKFSIEQINVLSEVFEQTGEPTANTAEKSSSQTSFHRDIVMKNISFGYEENHCLFDNLNVTIRKGDFVLLKGKSGKGKSTIVKILMGLIEPGSGQVLVDGTNLKNINHAAWYQRMGYVPQRPVIIEGTLEENICLGITYDEIDQQWLEQTIRYAQLDEVQSQVGETALSEEGGSISGGQAQRIGIARALFRKPEILFLDEPTSALDSKNAQLIIALLSKLNEENNITIIIISHSHEFDAYASKMIEL
ncbi:MAG: ABC transporter ATP-binding protein [Sediminibacterium magnilacihabitans]|nr:ABC transporter ATP-binding protein [Sediminibacterium magnilacihabitans]PQV60061.1 ABC-type bacteriocin/lantibiotic exporter with double-glycine peptidase domain [Sediminibacterium magnilacihabitans]